MEGEGEAPSHQVGVAPRLPLRLPLLLPALVPSVFLGSVCYISYLINLQVKVEAGQVEAASKQSSEKQEFGLLGRSRSAGCLEK